MMDLRKNILSILNKQVSWLVLIIVVAIVGCSKTDEVPSTIVIPPTPVITPSGEIQYFTINDTLVPFKSRSIVKWLVVGTNSQTIVTYNGAKVLFKGDIDTEPIKKATTYTLEVNSGKKATVSIKAADSLATHMWNSGKRLKIKKKEVYIIPLLGITDAKWVDTTKIVTDQVKDQRIYFHFTESAKIIQLTPQLYPPAPASSRFYPNSAQNTFFWQGTTFTVDYLDDTMMVVLYDELQPNGKKLLTRITYLFE
jgi:hypothetical protein